ncbi:MAG: acyl-ACP--UDP-N-acetylglucosamine O-acyltransferase [Desulfacinum sp.]|jgi:UDP-N-acetylglucosamine acyltransferase|nr:acyl-ACP--UDP-N-acetylglucosamine O-acyltransferase [Desulfacinum sp.]
MTIHPTAVVDPKAELAEGVTIGPYAVIGPNVQIDTGTVVGSHTVIDGWTQIGRNNQISSFASIGFPPQDLKYKGGPTRVEIGDNNIIREYATIHRGTEGGGGVTRIGNGNLIMAYVHVAHDCILQNHVIMANAAMLAGHVLIEDHAIVGGLAAVHQFARIGTHAYIGAKAGIKKDIPPYMLATGYPAKLYGPNTVGLKRKGFSSEAIQGLKKAYKVLFRSGLTVAEATRQIQEELGHIAEVKCLLDFVAGSQRGLTR